MEGAEVVTEGGRRHPRVAIVMQWELEVRAEAAVLGFFSIGLISTHLGVLALFD